MINQKIYCCGCGGDVQARLTNGAEIYPHRKDLKDLPFWRCDSCGGYVGCHHKTRDRTKPLGCIPTKGILEERKKIHAIIDPVWRSGRIKRSSLYKMMSDGIGYKYHTANIRTEDEARKIRDVATTIISAIGGAE